MDKEKIQNRIDEYQIVLQQWHDQLKDAPSTFMGGSISNPFLTLVDKEITRYTDRIAELKWVLDNCDDTQ